MSRTAAPPRLTDADYRALAEFRFRIRQFLDFSEAAADAAGLTGRQHQALLAIRGAASNEAVTIGYLAERLIIRHHSAGELVDRLEAAGLVRRRGDLEDHRKVLIELTKQAEESLAQLSAAHLDELARLGPALARLTPLGDSSPPPEGEGDRESVEGVIGAQR